MENFNKVAAKKKKARKSIIGESAKRKLLITVVVLAFVIAVGGFFAYNAGLPAMVLTGANFILTPEGGSPEVIEKIKVNELNYNYKTALSQLQQYGMIPQDFDEDAIFDEETGKTYKQYVYEFTCDTMLRNILIEKEARKDADFKPEALEVSVRNSVEELREAVEFNATVHGYVMTADQYLSSIYGPGTTVSAYASFLERQLIVDEYMQYLRQVKFMPSDEELTSLPEESAVKAELMTFHFYFFKAEYDQDATEEQKAEALAEAVSNAETVISRATDATSFRDICEELAGEENAAAFADGMDPTLAEDVSYAGVEQVSGDLADYLFAVDRVEGDMTVIENETGAFAAYFVSRSLDTTPTITYRVLRMDYNDEFDVDGNVLEDNRDEINQEANELIAQVTDEQSFASLVKKRSDDPSGTVSGGLVTGKTVESMFTEEVTSEHDRNLATWLSSPERKSGDMTAIRGENFVSVIYFVENIPKWQSNLRNMMIDEKYSQWYEALEEQGVLSYEIKYGNIEIASYRE
ncbi:MAG: peptidylprolyl isomerase [Clostridiales bacterium]|nr:peptidylprolyl isomerase [Clostridiales bacterium]